MSNATKKVVLNSGTQKHIQIVHNSEIPYNRKIPTVVSGIQKVFPYTNVEFACVFQ